MVDYYYYMLEIDFILNIEFFSNFDDYYYLVNLNSFLHDISLNKNN